MLEKKLIKQLKNVFAGYEIVQVVYLFGSYASNQENKFSDLDLGILLQENYNKMIKLDILTRLTEQDFTDIDLIILNNVSPLIQYEVVKNNKIIYKKKNFDTSEFFSLIVRKYLDFRPYLDIHRKYLKERIING